MDELTKKAYEENCRSIALEHLKLRPEELYLLARQYFHQSGKTLDLGCGSGRDTAWLIENGFDAYGVDYTEGFVEFAKEHFPKLSDRFFVNSLPKLQGIDDESFSNVFCSAVIQHIPRSDLLESIRNILRVLKPEGKLILSFRGPKGDSSREADKLYENYHIGQMASLFESFGAKVLAEKTSKEASRDLTWHTLVVEKTSGDKKSGISRIQDIIQRDAKTSTYKFALIRAFCEISLYEPHVVTWLREADKVLVPLKRVAIRWLHYYFPLIKNNLNQTTYHKLSFQEELEQLDFKNSDCHLFLKDLETNPDYKKIITKVSHAIKVGPVKYSGGEKNPHFEYMSKLDASLYPELMASENGMIAVPIEIWRDINQFSYWIEDSLLLQWAQMSVALNKNRKLSEIMELHTSHYLLPERSTYDIQKLFKNKKIKCVWSNIEIEKFDVDHMIPWALWHNNDLWNLLPCKPQINNSKSDKLPQAKVIEESFDRIKNFWKIYAENFETLFASQIKYSLGLNLNSAFTSEGRDSLIHTVERVKIKTGAVEWGK